MEKASVLGDAIRYIKYLHERVKTLEEQLPESSDSQLEDDGDGTSDENSPEIETRVNGKNILLRIQCEKRKGILVKILGEIEKLNLAVVSSNVAPFGSSSLNVTIIAEMEQEFCCEVKDVAESLRMALRSRSTT